MADDTPTRRFDPDDQPTIRGLSAGQVVFERYRLEAVAGRGGMGVVWRARDERLERPVALKFLPDVVAADHEAIRDLMRETRRSLELTHPNIVRVYDLVQDEQRAAISMEFVDGESLAKRKATAPEGRLSPAEVRTLAVQLCAALDYAHGVAKVVHRDLKPANLLVTTDGRLKVTDFGIARSLSDTHTRLTGRANDTSGTLLYMSPQQLVGADPTSADDLYALGATLYELLTGKPPFHSGDITLQIREVVPPPVNARLAALGAAPVPPAWEEAIAACLAKDPQDRPASAGEVAERMELAEGDRSQTTEVRSQRSVVRGQKSADRSQRSEGRSQKSDGGLKADAGSRRSEIRGKGPATPASSKSRLLALAIIASIFVVGVTGGVYLLKSLGLAPPPPVAATGGVQITTAPPEAEVAVGSFHARTSPVTLAHVPAGSYPVVARLAGYEDARGRVEVKGGATAALNLALVRSTGRLKVGSVPEGLKVEVSGEKPEGGGPGAKAQVATTPATLTLPTGEYVLTYSRPGWPDQGDRVTVKRNAVTTSTAHFDGGTLAITSTPAGAEVFSGGKRLGTTPLSLTDQSPGTYTLEFRLKGYRSATDEEMVVPKQTTQAAVTLVAIPVAVAGNPWTIPDLAGLALQPIPAGTFTMGSPPAEADRDPDEGPQTQVTFSRPFWVGRTEVTQAQWRAVMGNDPSHFKGDDLPVDSVSWDDAMAFCRKLTERERTADRLPAGYVYTLPTEAQWEYACRAGTTGPFAGDGRPDDLGWYSNNSAGTTHPVAQMQANAWGLYDMLGNVWEWCRNWYGPYPGGEVTDYAGPTAGTYRAIRGGCWGGGADYGRSAYRFENEPGLRRFDLGFRVALAPGS